MRSKLDPSRPLCAHCQAGRLKENRKPGPEPPRPPKIAQCRVCLAEQVITMRRGRPVSSLGSDGTCKDKLACEARQPPLFQIGEL